MPVHEYRCRMCATRFERLYRKLADVPETGDLNCPRCGGPVRRLVSAAFLADHADVGVGRAAWPRSWADTWAGDAEVLRGWRRRIEREIREEERDPELTQLRQANAIRQYEEQHGPGSAEASESRSAGHTHQAWTAVPFVAPTRGKP